MKKVVLLMVLVLGMSSTAWGICRVNADVVNLCCEEDKFFVDLNICCNGQCEFEDLGVTQLGNQLYVDIYLNCSCLDGNTCIATAEPVELVAPQGLRCGIYILAVRVWCSYDCWPYCMFGQPMFSGLGSTSFTACCDDCGCCPCQCWMFPCCVAGDG